MDFRPAKYFNLKEFQTEVIHFDSIKGLEYVVHENNKRRLLTDELQQAIKLSRIQGTVLRRLYTDLVKKSPENKSEILYNIRMILRNEATIFAFYHFAVTCSPCDNNVFRGMQKIVYEFLYVGDKKYPSYFHPEEITDAGFGDPAEGIAIDMQDGTQAIAYGTVSSKHAYRRVPDFLADLQSHRAKVQGPSYIIRSPYQMVMTLLQQVCENRLLLQKCSCCGKVFQPLSAGQKYCSRECSYRRKAEQTKSSKAKEEVKALRNFKQAVNNRFKRYCQGRTKDFALEYLKIPEEYEALIIDIKRAVTLRDQAEFYNALDDLIQNQKEKLRPNEYLYWLEHAGRKRKNHGNSRDSEK